jgi:hypothetical protein
VWCGCPPKGALAGYGMVGSHFLGVFTLHGTWPPTHVGLVCHNPTPPPGYRLRSTHTGRFEWLRWQDFVGQGSWGCCALVFPLHASPPPPLPSSCRSILVLPRAGAHASCAQGLQVSCARRRTSQSKPRRAGPVALHSLPVFVGMRLMTPRAVVCRFATRFAYVVVCTCLYVSRRLLVVQLVVRVGGVPRDGNGTHAPTLAGRVQPLLVGLDGCRLQPAAIELMGRRCASKVHRPWCSWQSQLPTTGRTAPPVFVCNEQSSLTGYNSASEGLWSCCVCICAGPCTVPAPRITPSFVPRALVLPHTLQP